MKISATIEGAGTVSTRNGHSRSLICGNLNPRSLNLSFQVKETSEVETKFSPFHELLGYMGLLHGGVIASLLDIVIVSFWCPLGLMKGTWVKQAFDAIADDYDHWFDTPLGEAIFQAELKCLRLLHEKSTGRWLEIGVGTGRFAHSLGIAEGIDPSPRMLEIAASRGITIHQGSAESLPFTTGSFDGLLMVLTLCFITNSDQAMKECLRVLRPGGRLLIGAVPADSSWGKAYIDKASKGHPIYTKAHFQTVPEIVELTQCAGFKLIDAASTLFWKPGEDSESNPYMKAGIFPEAGFSGLLFEK